MVRTKGMEYMDSFLLVCLDAANLTQCEVCDVSIVFLQERVHGELAILPAFLFNCSSLPQPLLSWSQQLLPSSLQPGARSSGGPAIANLPKPVKKRFRGYLSSSSGQWSLQGFESKWEEWSECPVQALRWESSAFYKCFLSRRHFIVACNRLLTVLWGNNVLRFLVQYFVETWFWGNKN